MAQEPWTRGAPRPCKPSHAGRLTYVGEAVRPPYPTVTGGDVGSASRAELEATCRHLGIVIGDLGHADLQRAIAAEITEIYREAGDKAVLSRVIVSRAD